MKIVVLDGFTLNPGDLTWDGLEALGALTIYERTSPEEILERSEGAEIILTNKTPINATVISALKSLKYIGVLATGYNVVDIEAAKNQGIIVTNVPAYSTDSVVQLTFALILELTLHAQKHSDAVREGKWANSKDFCFWDFPLMELAGKTIGIIGFGSIGQKVADVATAFGMKVIGHSRRQTDQSHRNNFKWESISTLLAESDFISIHCPLTAETQGLINRDNLQKMKRSAFLINTSRGPIVVEEDLAEALNNNIIAGAGIDVLSVEPPQKNNPLFTAQNCIITPHIAWATKEARTRLMGIATENILAYQSGNPKNIVNP
ncbi:D-2-hydroxyacid dehydrogenase [Arcicella sp. DC2W]|uniref:D-2-hydroxyacid dehydrogenase n=1 Tax=Arcicella gelida TaxID=2984195 RepID=A0ABU5S5L0_9BACT|nr:D-2-hydroxyacid dehydrogenase [Arcicella sp. DC2W]MEA5403774.1 D-2-hydroxyacid dehydrogenase [Arcicella sp. DC2W]